MTKREIFELEFFGEGICPICSSEMDEVKKRKSNKYKKESTIFKCGTCGHQQRKRTLNEIARDCGFRD